VALATQEMGMRCNTFGFWFRVYICFISVCGIRECWSLNDEGNFYHMVL